MSRKVVLCVLVVLLQVLQGTMPVESIVIKFGGAEWTGILSNLETTVPQIRSNPVRARAECTYQTFEPEFCSFVECVIADGRSNAFASSISHDCLMELMALKVLHNATLQEQYCSSGVETPECKFTTCVMKDPRGETAAKAVGMDCFNSSLSSTAGAPSAGTPYGGVPPSSSASGAPAAASTASPSAGSFSPSSSASEAPAAASTSSPSAGFVSPSSSASWAPAAASTAAPWAGSISPSSSASEAPAAASTSSPWAGSVSPFGSASEPPAAWSTYSPSAGSISPSSSASEAPAVASTSSPSAGSESPSSSASEAPVAASTSSPSAGSVSPSGLGSHGPTETSSGSPPSTSGSSSLSDTPSSVPAPIASLDRGASAVTTPPLFITSSIVFGLTLVFSMTFFAT